MGLVPVYEFGKEGAGNMIDIKVAATGLSSLRTEFSDASISKINELVETEFNNSYQAIATDILEKGSSVDDHFDKNAVLSDLAGKLDAALDTALEDMDGNIDAIKQELANLEFEIT